jgi:hypothetical protein
VVRNLLLAAAGLVLAGCQAPSQPTVLTRLPEPAKIAIPVPPPLVVIEPPAPPPVARAVVPPDWLPPAGLSQRWTSIVIHHTASDVGSLRDIDAWHRGNGWEGCGYHFVVGNGTRSSDGQVEVGPRWRRQTTGAHTRLHGTPSSAEGNYFNEHGIGIVLVGNFDRESPSPQQMEGLVRLVSYLSRTCDIPLKHVYFHGELKSTECPGRYLSKAQVLRLLMDAIARLDVNCQPTGG